MLCPSGFTVLNFENNFDLITYNLSILMVHSLLSPFPHLQFSVQKIV